MDGDHDLDTCEKITERVLKETFLELAINKVALEGIVLKPNMVISGKKAKQRAGVEEVAEKTVKLLKACVPAAVPGVPRHDVTLVCKAKPRWAHWSSESWLLP